MTTRLHVLLLAALLVGSAAPAWAQLTAEPSALSVAVLQGETTERTVTLTNTGNEAISFCISFDRPLQRSEAELRIGDRAIGGACGDIGEILYELNEEQATNWSPFGLAMTPDGRLFLSDWFDIPTRTHELTPELELIRSFPQPIVEEVGITTSTLGVAYNADTEKLWWLNIEETIVDQQVVLARALLLEGDLNGVATGRRIEIPPLLSGDPPVELTPNRLAYDPATARFYFAGSALEDGTTIWALDTLGVVVPGYPVRQTAYPGQPAVSLDAHGGASGEAEAVRLETVTPRPGDPFGSIIVLTPEGEGLGIGTPMPNLSGSTIGGPTGEPLRSRVDPNGVLYIPFANFDTNGLVGIRPHPLPPSWLALSVWSGELDPGESADITLTFSAGTRAVGNTYNAALQVFEAATGAALEVPLSLEVTESTAREDDPGLQADVSLSVYPNPLNSTDATVALSLGSASEASVEVFDVLGRRVAVLHTGPLPAGSHRLPLGTASLPAGVYLVRATAGAERLTEQIAIVR